MDEKKEEPIKRSIQLDLEVDATQKPEKEKNRFQVLIDLAEAVDAWRIFPRLFITVYIYLLYLSVTWFMTLQDPSTAQAGLISVITSIGAAWFTAYVVSGKKNKKDQES